MLKDRLGDAKLLARSKHLDEWSVDEVAAMLTELKMNEYVEFVQKNKVDGNLFINLSDDDWYVISHSLSSYSLTHSLPLTTSYLAPSLLASSLTHSLLPSSAYMLTTLLAGLTWE